MTERLPIRPRLTLWYSTVLAVCLVAFGVFTLRCAIPRDFTCAFGRQIMGLYGRFCGTLRAGILFFLKHQNDEPIVGERFIVEIAPGMPAATAPPGAGKR